MFGISGRTVQVELKQALMHRAIRIGREVSSPTAARRRLRSIVQRNGVRQALLSEQVTSAVDCGLLSADERLS
ncbi:hypothetical protein AS156_36990 [Bradyrhizobium macuxiense]|uniref:Uncharacterized protein n=1 Tax=Bradyrhizobium macuxiense TaxID=1755647 RepID=A0A109JZN3_9BRAD|nr:hypothetical protein [Bradyrhizobium macuxiense]KWV57809.1 hypothetical protein AS156_36990 [Bradyrhizobium macuxiense]